MNIKIIVLFLTILTLSISAEKLLPFTSDLPRVSMDYRPILQATWEGVKERNIDPYSIKAIHRPKSELPGDFVSEGIGYGMILALYANDQDYFNKIWDAGEKYMWSSGSYNWRCNESGKVIGGGPATDAEEDIACMLIFANKLVEAKIWTAHTSPKGATYKERAEDLISFFPNFLDNDKIVLPWSGGYGQTNIGYFAPAFYRVFDEFQGKSNTQTWTKVIANNYSVLEANPGYDKGLVADWLDTYGNFLPSGPGYNAYAGGKYMYKDAIRIYWRVATDYLWFGEPRAKKFLDNAMAFLRSKGGAKAANFYDMNGDVVPETDVWEEMNAGDTYRSRREHSALTVGMWAPVVLVSGTDEEKEEISNELLSFYEGKNYWGHATSTEDYGTDIVGPDGMKFYEDTLHNEMYFDQFLGWFGASLISGNFVNVMAELDNQFWDGIATFTEDLVASKNIVDNKLEVSVKATISKSSYYTVTVHNKDEDKKIVYTLFSTGIVDTSVIVDLDELYDLRREDSNVEVTLEIEDGASQAETFTFSKVEDYFFKEYSMHIGPDPMNDVLSISFNLKENADLSFVIYNLSKEEVMSFQKRGVAGENSVSYDIDSLEKGIYKLIIKIKGETNKVVTLYKI